MKNFTRFLILCLTLVCTQAALQAQCNFTGTAYTVSNAPTSCTPLTNTLFYFSEYATFNNLTIGATYTFTATVTSAGVAPYSFNLYTSNTAGGAPVTFVNGSTTSLTISNFVATTTTVYLKNFSSATGACSSPGSGGGFNSFTIQCTSCAGPATPPTCPTISAPAANATGVSVLPTITYGSVTGAVSYNIYLNADATCTTSPTTLLANTTALSYTLTTPLNPSTQYGIRVVAIDCGGGMSTACAERCFTTGSAPPANDNCGGATFLPVSANGACSFSAISTTGATQSTPNPACTTTANNDDVWYTFTTGIAGPYAFTFNSLVATSGTATALGMDVYTGSCPAALTTVTGACTATYGSAGAGTRTVTLAASTTYFLRVYTAGASNSGTFNLCIETPLPPPNCATNLMPTNGSTVTLLCSPNPSSVVFNFTAPAGGPAPTGYKFYLGTGTPALLTTVTTPTVTVLNLLPNTAYNYYVVPTNGNDATGCDIPVTFTTGPEPACVANNSCATATQIGTTPTTSTTTGATISQVAEACATFTGNADDDVWFKFNTNATGGGASVALTAPATTLDAVIQVYSGTCGALTNIGCADATVSGAAETATVTGLAANSTYYVRVYGYGAFSSTSPTTGAFTIAVTGTALPLELKSFTGKVEGSVNMLSWETLTEKNVKSHLVERSIDGVKWSEIGRKASYGDSQVLQKYELEDRSPLVKAYYRLRSIDFDGQENISNVILLTRKGEHFGITTVFPSPTTDNVTVQFVSTQEESVTVRVMDMTGRVVLTQSMEAAKDVNELPVTLHGLQAGVYTVTVSNSTNTSAPVRFVKQ